MTNDEVASRAELEKRLAVAEAELAHLRTILSGAAHLLGLAGVVPVEADQRVAR